MAFYPWIISHCLDGPQFIYPSPVEWCLGCFQFLAIMKQVAINIVEQIFGSKSFQPNLVNPKELDCGFYSKSLLHLCKKPPNCLPKWLRHCASPPAMTEIPAARKPHQHLVWSVFWILAILTGISWEYIFTSIFPDGEYLCIRGT